MFCWESRVRILGYRHERLAFLSRKFCCRCRKCIVLGLAKVVGMVYRKNLVCWWVETAK